MGKHETILFDKAGTRVDPGSVHTARPEWVEVASTLSAGDEPTDLGVAERTYQTAKTAQIADVGGDGKIAFYDVPRESNAIRLRAMGITGDGTYTIQVYFGTLGDGNRDTDDTLADCELAYAGQLAFVIGTQASVTATYKMADTVVATGPDWAKSWIVSNPGQNRVAEAFIDLMGADLVVIVPTEISANAKLIARGF